MSLIDHVLKHVRSAGHSMQSEEHQLLEEFAAFLSSESPIKAFLEKKGIKAGSDNHQVISDFSDKSEPKYNKFLFEIKVPREFLKQTDDYIYDKLKLIKKIIKQYLN